MLTRSQRRSFDRHGAREIQRTIDAAKAELAADAARERAAHPAVMSPPAVTFTVEQIKAATHIRTDVGWHKVVRVNAKSVTVATGYSWTDRYAIARVLDVRTIPAA